MSAPILALRDVSKRFVKSLDAAERMANLVGAGLHDEIVHAVDGVSLAIATGEVVGLVGESGCGKSTLGKAIVGLNPITEGSVRLEGREVAGLSRREMRPLRPRVQMIFQVKGATKDGMVSLEAYKRSGQYHFEMLSLDISDGEHLFLEGSDDHPLFPELKKFMKQRKLK